MANPDAPLELDSVDCTIIFDALQSQRYDVENDPDDFQEGALQRLDATIAKIEAQERSKQNPIYLPHEG